MQVTMVGRTMFHGQAAAALTRSVWVPENDDAQDLVEFAGRACYQSWNRPNPATATNEGYIGHIIDVGHFSVLEHASMTFYVEDVSRSLTHELVRHRHLSFSQLSQRFVEPENADADEQGPIVPPLFEDEAKAREIIWHAWDVALDAYNRLHGIAEDMGAKRKQAREAARSVLPNMMPTAIVVTGNHRAWREFITKRATIHADAEICALAVEILQQCKLWEPHLYQDMHLTDADGRNVVTFGKTSVVTHSHGQHEMHSHTYEEYINHQVPIENEVVES